MDGLHQADKMFLYQALFCPNDLDQLLQNSSQRDKIIGVLDSNKPPLTNGTGELTEDRNASWYNNVENILHTKVVVAIGILGVIGNILNLIVLTQRGLSFNLGRMEKFAHAGMVSLAVSDMLFCLTTIPYCFVDIHAIYFSHVTFYTIYNLYSNAVINVFVMASTMLTVMMAAGRYFAIVHPIKARQFIGMTCAGRSIFLVFLACIGFNVPRFFRYQLLHVTCPSGHNFYVREDGVYKDFELKYLSCYFVLGILLPLLILAASNTFLIRTLHQAKNRIVRFRKNESQQDTSQRVTLTLVIIVIVYLLLVTPAEMINIWRQTFSSSISESTKDATPSSNKFNMAVAVVNTLESINFAFNFVLYCIINTHFRRVVANLIKCRWHILCACNRTQNMYDSTLSESTRSTTATSLRTYVYNGLSVRGGAGSRSSGVLKPESGDICKEEAHV